MKQKTLEYALEILNIQYGHAHNPERASAEQTAFYDGMKMMLEIVVTDGYVGKSGLYQEGPTHYVKRGNGSIIKGNW